LLPAPIETVASFAGGPGGAGGQVRRALARDSTTIVLDCSLLRSLGHSGPVRSPTYTLVELYVVSGLYLYHFDFYRFNQPDEYLDAGLDEYFDGKGVCLVEWPDRAGPHLPAPDLRVHLRFAAGGADCGRLVDIAAASAEGRRCLTNFRFPTPAATASASPPPA
jgi:tRNA threonylcarbamoyladenosine biosynthesis protein TsaE